MSIKFGTDGWRAIIGDDFTFANVRHVARGIGGYLLSPRRKELALYTRAYPQSSYKSVYRSPYRGVVIGYDSRMLSPEAGWLIAEELSAMGIPCFLSDTICTTPALSLGVRDLQAAAGVMVTASHNPAIYNGIKFKPEYAGSALPLVVKEIEKHLDQDYSGAPSPADIESVDLKTPYLNQLKSLVDWQSIQEIKVKILSDPMYGASRGYFAGLLSWAEEIRGGYNPGFGGVNPEPIPPNVDPLIRAIATRSASAGFAFDGDGDRVGAVDENGKFVNSHEIFALILKHLLYNRKLTGGIVKSFSTTTMIDILANKNALPYYVTPIGFKSICELMLSEDILMGGEESGGFAIKGYIPERDGILSALLLLEYMAYSRKSLGELLRQLRAEIGEFYASRIDLKVKQVLSKEVWNERISKSFSSLLADYRIKEVQDLDGVKFILENGSWLLFRSSGTEPMLRIYAESNSPQATEFLLKTGKNFVERIDH